jgi:hypothetical protein
MANVQENTANWEREAIGYLRANLIVPDPVEMSAMSCLSDVQELIAHGDLDRANFYVNVAKVLIHNGSVLLVLAKAGGDRG